MFFKRDIDKEFLEIPKLDFEFGFQAIIQDKVKSLLSSFESRIPTFYLKQQYIDWYSSFDRENNLTLNFFGDTFRLFFLVISLTIATFVGHHLVRLASRGSSASGAVSKSATSVQIIGH